MHFSKNTWYILKDESVKDFAEWVVKNTSKTSQFLNSIDMLIVDLQQGFQVLSVSGCLGGLLEIQLYDGRVMRGKDYHPDWSSLTISGCAEFFHEIGRYPDLWRTGRFYGTDHARFDAFRASSKTNKKIANKLLQIFGCVERIRFKVEEIDSDFCVWRLENSECQDELAVVIGTCPYIFDIDDIRYFYPIYEDAETVKEVSSSEMTVKELLEMYVSFRTLYVNNKKVESVKDLKNFFRNELLLIANDIDKDMRETQEEIDRLQNGLDKANSRLTELKNFIK